MRFPTRLLVLLACSCLLASCGGSSGGDDPGESLVEVPTTAPVDPWAVPDVIDAEYVRRVLQRLEDVRAEVRRDVYASHQFTDVDRKKIEAMNTGHRLAFALDEWPRLAVTNHPDIKPDPGSAVVSVQQVLTGRPDCIWVNARFDESLNLFDPARPTQAQLVLVAKDHDLSLNPTPYVTKQFTIPGQIMEEQACG